MGRSAGAKSIISNVTVLHLVPTEHRREVLRPFRTVRDRLPPFAIERQINTLDRRLGTRLRHPEAQVDELLRQVGSKAA
jgi:hypothetical protein